MNQMQHAQAAPRHEAILNIGGISVRMRADGSTPRAYRMMFGRDILRDISMLTQAVTESGDIDGDVSEILEDIAYCMAKQADPEIGPIEEWLARFGMLELYGALGGIIDIWGANTRTTAVAKKKRGRRRGK